MLTKNVVYSERPDQVIVTRLARTAKCLVELPVNVREETDTDEGGQTVIRYICDVYAVTRNWDPGLHDAVVANFSEWLETAQEESVPETTIEDVVEALNMLTSIVLGE